MTQPIPQYSAVNSPFVDPATGLLSQAGATHLRQLWLRVGGAIAPTNNELSATEYADAGIECIISDVYALRDELRSVCGEISALQAMVAEHTKRLQDAAQGVLI